MNLKGVLEGILFEPKGVRLYNVRFAIHKNVNGKTFKESRIYPRCLRAS